MKAFWLAALQTIVRTLIGAMNYERVKVLVTELDSSVLSGPEKRERVDAVHFQRARLRQGGRHGAHDDKQ